MSWVSWRPLSHCNQPAEQLDRRKVSKMSGKTCPFSSLTPLLRPAARQYVDSATKLHSEVPGMLWWMDSWAVQCATRPQFKFRCLSWHWRPLQTNKPSAPSWEGFWRFGGSPSCRTPHNLRIGHWLNPVLAGEYGVAIYRPSTLIHFPSKGDTCPLSTDLGVSINGGTHKGMVRENPMKMDDWGLPLLQETSISSPPKVWGKKSTTAEVQKNQYESKSKMQREWERQVKAGGPRPWISETLGLAGKMGEAPSSRYSNCS